MLWGCILNSQRLKAALVTGAAHRIGRHIALDLAARGIAVAIHHNNSEEDAEAAVDEILACGGDACTVQADLTDPEQTAALLENAQEALGQPFDILLNNASIFEDDRLESFSAALWLKHQQVNLLAPLLLTQAFAANLPEGRHGAIINIIDQRVLKPNPQYLSYSLSKSGLFNATKSCAQALAPQRIRVNAIAPGPTLANKQQSKADFATESASVLLGSGPSLEEIASTVHFILENGAMTGQMIAVDGGQHLAWRTDDILED
ncbi:MAG: SDR family oxidoreductase [Kordiimonadaceae bacterium]|nr:SDR family oxidoreductase [Kordiimonadaceae bacterium]